jgi:hypothetical protein
MGMHVNNCSQYSCPPLCLAIEDVVAIEVAILTGWVDDAVLDISEQPKSNGDGDLGLGWGPPTSSYALG